MTAPAAFPLAGPPAAATSSSVSSSPSLMFGGGGVTAAVPHSAADVKDIGHSTPPADVSATSASTLLFGAAPALLGAAPISPVQHGGGEGAASTLQPESAGSHSGSGGSGNSAGATSATGTTSLSPTEVGGGLLAATSSFFGSATITAVTTPLSSVAAAAATAAFPLADECTAPAASAASSHYSPSSSMFSPSGEGALSEAAPAPVPEVAVVTNNKADNEGDDNTAQLFTAAPFDAHSSIGDGNYYGTQPQSTEQWPQPQAQQQLDSQSAAGMSDDFGLGGFGSTTAASESGGGSDMPVLAIITSPEDLVDSSFARSFRALVTLC